MLPKKETNQNQRARGNKMVKQHLKRIFTPNTWKIKRKANVFITRPKPGAHPLSKGMSINTFFKDMTKHCKTTKEVKQIMHNKEVLVDGTRRKDHRLLVGFMDVISIPSVKENYRIIISDKGHLTHISVPDKESNMKLSKIMNKTLIKGGKVQINFDDGRNITIKKNEYRTGDTIVMSLPDQKIMKHLKLDVGAQIILTGGSHIGKIGQLSGMNDKVIAFKTKDGQEFETKIDYAFVIGEKTSEITIE